MQVALALTLRLSTFAASLSARCVFLLLAYFFFLRISSCCVFIFPASSHPTVLPDPRVAAMLLSVLVIVTIAGVSICATKGG
jgi:hypothetical protein